MGKTLQIPTKYQYLQDINEESQNLKTYVL